MTMDEEAPPIVLEEGSKAYRIVSRTVKRKLVEMFPEYGIDEPDNVMCEYIQVLLCNRKQRSQVIADLTPFLEDGAPRFIKWLWDYLRFLADSFEERPQLSGGRSKSVARDIDLIHDKRKREMEVDEEYQAPSRQAQSSSRRSTARGERHQRRVSPHVIDCDDEDDDSNSDPGPRRGRRGRRHVAGHMNGTTVPAVAYTMAPVAYQSAQGVAVVQYVPAGSAAAPVALAPAALLGPNGTAGLTAASAAPNFGAAAPAQRRNGEYADGLPPAKAPPRGQPNRRPTWLANPPDEDQPDSPRDQPPVRFMVTFRGVPQHPPVPGRPDGEDPDAALAAPPRGGRPLRYGAAEEAADGGWGGVPAASAPLQYGVGRHAPAAAPHVTVTFGGAPRAAPTAPLHYSSPPVAPLPPTLYVGPTPGIAGLPAGLGLGSLMTENFIPSNNTPLCAPAMVGAQRVIAASLALADRTPEVPAFKRLRGGPSLVIDFDDDGEEEDGDAPPQDWASQNVDVMGSTGFGRAGRRTWQDRGGSAW
eukprot:EG_transcript_5961